jgi:hypothetical protein
MPSFFYLFVFLIKDSRAPSAWLSLLCFTDEFCSGVYNQYELFICLDLIVKNRNIPIERYFKLWNSTKLV